MHSTAPKICKLSDEKDVLHREHGTAKI